MRNEEYYIRRCLQLARCAEGMTYPNPMVGAVVVWNDEIIGEGYHIKAGGPHAEVNAIASVRKPELLKESTIYVSLEPCAHYGKTPPCAKLIIDKEIPRVVVGCGDSFSKVAGKGISMLREAGVEVSVGVLEEECRWLNRRFFTYHEKKRPYVILKWAQSADGFISGGLGVKGEWLTNDVCRRMVHKQRAEEQAILVGANTANYDDPALTIREWAGAQPIRLVVDPKGSLRSDLRMLNDGGETKVLRGTSAKALCGEMYELGIQSVVVEGGRQTLETFIGAGLFDEAYVYRSPKLLGGGIEAPKIDLSMGEVERIGECELVRIVRS